RARGARQRRATAEAASTGRGPRGAAPSWRQHNRFGFRRVIDMTEVHSGLKSLRVIARSTSDVSMSSEISTNVTCTGQYLWNAARTFPFRYSFLQPTVVG